MPPKKDGDALDIYLRRAKDQASAKQQEKMIENNIKN